MSYDKDIILIRCVCHPNTPDLKDWKEIRQLLPDDTFEEIESSTLQKVRGTVQADILKEDQAQVVLAIEDGITVYNDAIASIKTRGIIGEKFMGLSPGGSGDPLSKGGVIVDTESGIDLEQVISQFIHGTVE